MPATKYLPYVRVSERSQSWHDKSIESSAPLQEKRMREWVKTYDPKGEILPALWDEFESGFKGMAPAMRQIERELQEGTAEWDTLVVLKIDRFSRHCLNGNWIFHLLQKHNKGFISIQENIDFNSIHGAIVFHTTLAFAEARSKQISKDTRDKMQYMASQGHYVTGNPPYGYSCSNKLLKPDEATAANVRGIYAAYAAGISMPDIQRRYNVPKNTALKILDNPTYLGKIRYKGELYDGHHEPLVDQATYDAAQAMRPKRASATRPRAAKYPYLLTGLISCECGRTLTPCTQTRRGIRIPYYRCSDTAQCPNRSYVRADELEKDLLEGIAKYCITDAVITETTAQLKRAWTGRKNASQPELDRARKGLSHATKTIGNLTNAFATGMVTPANAPLINAQLQNETEKADELKQLITTLEKAADPGPCPWNKATVKAHWQRLSSSLDTTKDPQKMRALIQSQIHRITRQGKGFRVQYRVAKATGSTKGLQWHPHGDLVELVLGLVA